MPRRFDGFCFFSEAGGNSFGTITLIMVADPPSYLWSLQCMAALKYDTEGEATPTGLSSISASICWTGSYHGLGTLSLSRILSMVSSTSQGRFWIGITILHQFYSWKCVRSPCPDLPLTNSDIPGFESLATDLGRLMHVLPQRSLVECIDPLKFPWTSPTRIVSTFVTSLLVLIYWLRQYYMQSLSHSHPCLRTSDNPFGYCESLHVRTIKKER